MTEVGVKTRIIVMARKKDIPQEITSQGWIDLDDLVEGVKPLERPEIFDGARAHETAAIYFSSGMQFPLLSVKLSSHNSNLLAIRHNRA